MYLPSTPEPHIRWGDSGRPHPHESFCAGRRCVRSLARLAHTTLVVAVPGLGDDIQAMKAGILEVGDLFIVNKADRPDTDKTVAYLENIFRRVAPGAWRPPVIKAQALHNKGIADIWSAIVRHQDHVKAGDAPRRSPGK